MTVKEFDHYLCDLVCRAPEKYRENPSRDSVSWMLGFFCAISIVRKFLRENLHHEEKAS